MTAEPQINIFIDIGICTFRRPELRETLHSLFVLEVPERVVIRLIVADNDERPSARELVDGLRGRSPFPISYVHCPKSNISIARNACLAESDGEFLAFIDDDEVAAPTWLSDLYEAHLVSSADVVLGPVRALYDDDAPHWMRKGDFHSTRPVWVNGLIRTGYTCNVLLDMRSPHVADRRFDLALGQSGGEDTQFFSAMTRDGGRIAFAANALLEEPVPTKRASFEWLSKRRFRSGQTHGRILASQHQGTARIVQAFLAACKFSYCALIAAMTAAFPVSRNKYALRAALHAGVVVGIFGGREIRQYGFVEA